MIPGRTQSGASYGTQRQVRHTGKLEADIDDLQRISNLCCMDLQMVLV